MLYMFAALIPPPVGGQAMGGTGGSAMRTLEYPPLAFIFALVLAGYSVWDLDQLSGRRRLASAVVPPTAAVVPALAAPGSAAAAHAGLEAAAGSFARQAMAGPVPVGEAVSADAPGPAAAHMALLSPDVTVGCRIALGITMAFMLVIMI
jgi:hypothetical protein